MTIHQAKGLEFPVVIVDSIRYNAQPDVIHHLEQELAQFYDDPVPDFEQLDPEQKVLMDGVRLFYVAYSRAQYLLVVVGSQNQLCNGNVAKGGNPKFLLNHTIEV